VVDVSGGVDVVTVAGLEVGVRIAAVPAGARGVDPGIAVALVG
jgi:hypothetical protein